MSGPGGGNMERILRLMADKGASDCYLSANMPVLIRINGQTVQLSDQILTPSQPRQLISEVIEPAQLHIHVADGFDKAPTFHFSRHVGYTGFQDIDGEVVLSTLEIA